MLIARFLYRNNTHYGIFEGDTIELLRGTLFEGTIRTKTKVSVEDVTFLAPVEPSTVIGLGRNYHSHIKQMNVEPPEEPAIFFKPGRTVIGPGMPIIIPRWATRVDYEGELGIVIGKKMHSVSEADAAGFIFGCTCFNDVTERHIGSIGLINQDISKCCDTFGPCGPFISTEVEPGNTELKTYLNGTLVQQDYTGNTVFTVERILSHLSSFMTLMPGDLVVTGTPGGIGPLSPGDTVTIEIEGIGSLSNPVKLDRAAPKMK